MAEHTVDPPDATENPGKPDEGGAWQGAAAFLCFGMAVGAPAAETLSAIRFLPGERTVESILAIPVFVIGPIALARIIAAPFVDALGRRRRTIAILVALLLVLTAPILAMAAPGNPLSMPVRPLDAILLLAAMLAAGALLAAVDGLRSVAAPERTQGGLAAAQYLGTVIPAAVLRMFTQSPSSLTISVFLCGFVAVAWLGLWLLPRRERTAPPLLARPELKGFLAAEQNLSSGGKAVTARLYGTFILPFVDFFRRFGGLAWAILAVLVFGDLATHVDTRALLEANARLLNNAQILRIGIIRDVAQYAGVILAALFVWRMGAARGLAATFGLAAAAALSGIVAMAAAPSSFWFTVALAVGAVAQGAILIGFVAFIARTVAPAYAAWQFSLLWIAGLPTDLIRELRGISELMVGVIGSYVVFLILLAAAIALTVWLARQLDARESPG